MSYSQLTKHAFLLIFSINVAWAQDTELPSCSSIAADPDGDGFGFENQQSCRVDANSSAKPEITNAATGMPVDLIRPYWNANRDIANRDINCFGMTYDSGSRNFIPYSTGEAFVPPEPEHRYVHQPLPDTAPYVNVGVKARINAAAC